METTVTSKRVFTNKFESAVCERCGKSIDIGHPISWKRRQEGEKRSHVWHHPMCPGELNYGAMAKAGQALYQSTNATDEEINEANEAIQRDAQQTVGYIGQDEVTTPLEEFQKRAQEAIKANGSHSDDALEVLKGLGKILDPFMGPKQAPIDEKTVERIVTRTLTKDLDMHIDEALKGKLFQTVTKVTLTKSETKETKELGLQHKRFPELLRLANLREDIWLPGPAGSGKTKAVENIAKALGLKFYHIGALDCDYKLMGFVDANGRVVHTLFREWFINGGVICFDECDSWLPSAALALNSALANGHCTFPDGMYERHPDAVAIACANTYGLGDGNTDYVGRYKHDAAFLDRFGQMAWGYDEGLEYAMVVEKYGDSKVIQNWIKRVQGLRAMAKSKGLKVLITPRASMKGAKILAGGESQSLADELYIKKAMTAEQWASIQ